MQKSARFVLTILLLTIPLVSHAQNADVKGTIANGWEAMERNALDEALTEFDKALAIDPANTEAMVGKARALLYLNRLNEAEEMYMRVLKKDPENQSAVLGLARAHNWQGHYDQAVTEYAHFLELSPNDVEAQNELAQIHQWQKELSNTLLVLDPRETDALESAAKMKPAAGTSQKFFVNYLTERDTGDFRSHTTAYGYRVRKPLKSGDDIFAEYRLENYQESGKGHTVGNAVVLGGHHQALENLGVNGQIDLRTYTNDVDFFAGGMTNAVWNYCRKNTLTVQYDHDLFDVLDDVRANRYSAELNNYLLEKLLLTNAYQYSDLSDDNNAQVWSHALSYQILKQVPDLSVTVGYRHRDYEDVSPNYYSPQDLGSIFYAVYLGKAIGKTYSYTMVKFTDNDDDIDNYSYLVGTEYTLKENLSLGLEVNYFDTTDKYHALGASLALHWKF